VWAFGKGAAEEDEAVKEAGSDTVTLPSLVSWESSRLLDREMTWK